MNAKTIIVQTIVGAAVLGGAALLMMSGGREPETARGRAAGQPVVSVAEVTNSSIRQIIESLGNGVSRESVDITAKATDKVIKVAFEDCQLVTQGALLVQLENAAQIAERAQALVNVEEQQREYKRMQTLWAQQALAEKELDERRSMLARAEALRDVIDAQLRDRRITAPFSGMLGMRGVSVGDLVTPGTVVTALDDIGEIRADFRVPERHLAALKIGQEFTAHTAAYPGEKFVGIITALAPRVNPATRSVEVRGCIPNPDMRLRPGMLFDVELDLGTRDVLLIPEKAVMSLGEVHYLYVCMPDKTVRRREVDLGERLAGQVEIAGGLELGERIVTEGVAKLADGMAVTIAEESTPAAP